MRQRIRSHTLSRPAENVLCTTPAPVRRAFRSKLTNLSKDALFIQWVSAQAAQHGVLGPMQIDVCTRLLSRGTRGLVCPKLPFMQAPREAIQSRLGRANPPLEWRRKWMPGSVRSVCALSLSLSLSLCVWVCIGARAPRKSLRTCNHAKKL